MLLADFYCDYPQLAEQLLQRELCSSIAAYCKIYSLCTSYLPHNVIMFFDISGSIVHRKLYSYTDDNYDFLPLLTAYGMKIKLSAFLTLPWVITMQTI